MAVQNKKTFADYVLSYFSTNPNFTLTSENCTKILNKYRGLSSQLSLTPTNITNKFMSNVRKMYLAGLLTRIGRGEYTLSKKGKNLLKK